MGFHSRLKLGTFPAASVARPLLRDVLGPLLSTVHRPRDPNGGAQSKKVKKVPQGCDGTAKGIESSSACAVLFGSYPLNIHE